MERKNWIKWGIILVVIILVILGVWKSQTKNENIKIGMIIPISGPAADYGEQMKNGAEMAKQELLKQGKNIEIAYEDSKAEPITGISAYKRLLDIDKSDYLVSAFTRVGIPLIEMSAKDKKPLIMTIFAGDWDKTKSPYALRFFPTPRQYVRGENNDNTLLDTKTISVLYVNDDYGKSVLKEIELFMKEKNITILDKEGYTPSSSDFRTILTKIKQSNSDIVFIVSSNAVEISNIIKQSKEVDIKAKLFDSSISLSNPNVYKNPSNNVEGVITRATLAEIKDKRSDAEIFFTNYKNTYGKDPYWAALFGYESVKLISNIDSNNGRTNLQKAVMSIQPLKTIFGEINISDYQEINPTIINVEVREGNLVPIK